jgi:hypothetical protein
MKIKQMVNLLGFTNKKKVGFWRSCYNSTEELPYPEKDTLRVRCKSDGINRGEFKFLFLTKLHRIENEVAIINSYGM